MNRWSTYQLWALGPVLASTIAIVDLLTGPRIVLIGLLVIGPAHVMMTGRWLWTALTSMWVAGLAVGLGIHDHIWGTQTHVALIAAVAAIGGLATLEAPAFGSRRV
jgi:hypothetical protein